MSAILNAGQQAQAPGQPAAKDPIQAAIAAGFGDATPEQPKVEEKAPEQEAAPKEPEKKPEPASQSIADQIRAAREARAQRAREEADRRAHQDELARTKAELERLKSAKAFEEDPLGYVRGRKLTRDQQAYIGQLLLYDLVPDKADPNVRIDLMEAKRRIEETQRAETERERQEREAKEAEARAAEERENQLRAYQGILHTATKTFEPGAYPESEDWFGGDEQSYIESLFATANNLAEVAAHTGQAADLSPANVARVLEQELAERQKRREERRGKRAPQKQSTETVVVTNKVSGEQPAGTTTSTQGLGVSGQGRPPAQDDAERIRRAIERGFGA